MALEQEWCVIFGTLVFVGVADHSACGYGKRVKSSRHGAARRAFQLLGVRGVSGGSGIIHEGCGGVEIVVAIFPYFWKSIARQQ